MFIHSIWDIIGSICRFGLHPKLIEDIIPPMNIDPKNDPAITVLGKLSRVSSGG